MELKRNHDILPIAQASPRSLISESYRTIRTNIQFSSVAKSVQVILITSTTPGEGKSSTASNLAVVSAQSGRRVLLIDADMRKSQVHRIFKISNLRGLSTALLEEGTLIHSITKTDISGLHILPCGPTPPNPADMLASDSFSKLITYCRQEFDLTIIDSPPVLSAADALVLTNVSDGVVFVINSKQTSRRKIVKALYSLEQVHANLLGIVLNRVCETNAEYYYNYYSDLRNYSAVPNVVR